MRFRPFCRIPQDWLTLEPVPSGQMSAPICSTPPAMLPRPSSAAVSTKERCESTINSPREMSCPDTMLSTTRTLTCSYARVGFTLVSNLPGFGDSSPHFARPKCRNKLDPQLQPAGLITNFASATIVTGSPSSSRTRASIKAPRLAIPLHPIPWTGVTPTRRSLWV